MMRTVHPISIQLSAPNPSDPDVPHIAGAVPDRIQLDDPARLHILHTPEELEPNADSVATEQREVDAAFQSPGAKRQRNAPAQITTLTNLGQVRRERALRSL
jgi:hypothetical protein